MPEFTKRPNEEYQVTITFACDPTRTQDLVKAFVQRRGRPQTNGQASTGGRCPGGAAADLETDSRQNGYVLGQLAFAYQYDEPVADPANLRTIYDQLSPALLRDAARRTGQQPVCEGVAVP